MSEEVRIVVALQNKVDDLEKQLSKAIRMSESLIAVVDKTEGRATQLVARIERAERSLREFGKFMAIAVEN